MAKINIRVDNKAVENTFSALITGQFKFALAKTLTGLAFDVREDAAVKAGNYLDIRTPFVKNRGLRIIKANKKDIDIKSSVGVTTQTLADSITGGTKQGRQAVPTGKSRSLLNPLRKTLGPARFPRKVLNKKRPVKGIKAKAFVFRSKRGKTSGKEVIAIRTTKRRSPLRTLYVMENSIKVKKKWRFVEDARKVVKANYVNKLNRNIKQAILTSK